MDVRSRAQVPPLALAAAEEKRFTYSSSRLKTLVAWFRQ